MANDRGVKPYRVELQAERHCSQCGTVLPKDIVAVCAVLPLDLGPCSTNAFVVWCDSCWQRDYDIPGVVVRDWAPPPRTLACSRS